MANWDSLPQLTSDLDVIQKLDDEPNDVGGLTAAQLKAKFDEAGNAIKTYLNSTLLPAVKLAGEGTEGDIAGWDAIVAGILDGVSIDSFADVESALAGKQATLTFDNTPTTSSTNPVTSGGVKSYVDTGLSGKQNTLTFDATPTNGSSNPVTSDGVYDALATKQGTLTFDNTPTTSSTNPVTSGGVKSYVDTGLAAKQNTLTFDNEPTQDSTNPVTSGGVYTAIASAGVSTVTSVNSKVGAVVLNNTDVGAEASGAVSTHNNDSSAHSTLFSGKQNTLTFDNAPTEDSNNPVKSGGVYSALAGKAPTAHDSSATTYGKGTDTNYGHFKLSASTSSTSGTSGGIAATPSAIKAVNDRITYGNTDLTAGTSSLTTGVFYAYYT